MVGKAYDPIHDIFQDTSTSILQSRSDLDSDPDSSSNSQTETDNNSNNNSEGPVRVAMPVRLTGFVGRRMPVLSKGSSGSSHIANGNGNANAGKNSEFDHKENTDEVKGKDKDKDKSKESSDSDSDETTQSEDQALLPEGLPVTSTVKVENKDKVINDLKEGQLPQQQQQQRQKQNQNQNQKRKRQAQGNSSKKVRRTSGGASLSSSSHSSSLNHDPVANNTKSSTNGGNSGSTTTTNTTASMGKHIRHLKKPDGDYFTRKDIQYTFIDTLLNDKREVFTNIFKDFYLNSLSPSSSTAEKQTNNNLSQKLKKETPNTENGKDNSSTKSTTVLNVNDPNFNARRFIHHERLTFSQLYLLNIATSTKCSKILRDKLLSDHNVAHSTCLLGILVNIKRLNTTINFYLEMTSQLRTFHCVPSLQYSSSDPKSLQDTPRLKSILKNLPVGNEPIDLPKLYGGKSVGVGRYNVANMVFAMLDNLSLINSKFLNNEKFVKVVGGGNDSKSKDHDNGEVTLFQILDTYYFDTESRVNAFLWLIYVHLETDLSDSAVENSLKLFGKEIESGSWKIVLQRNTLNGDEIDVDLDYEVKFGLDQKRKRREFLEKIQMSKESLGKEKDTKENDGNENSINTNNTNVSVATTEDGTQTSSPKEKRRRKRKRKTATDLEEETVAETKSQAPNGGNEVETGEYKVKRRRGRGKKKETIIKEEDGEVKDNNNNSNTDDNDNDNDEKKDVMEKLNEDTPPSDLNKDNDAGDTTVESLLDVSTTGNNASADSNKDRINRLIKLDLNKKIHIDGEVDRTQQEFLDDLVKAHEWIRLKRQEVGLLKIFNEYEDITMASVIGIRGKKRRKFKDNLLGFETDYLRNFTAAKKFMLKKIGEEEGEVDPILFSLG